MTPSHSKTGRLLADVQLGGRGPTPKFAALLLGLGTVVAAALLTIDAPTWTFYLAPVLFAPLIVYELRVLDAASADAAPKNQPALSTRKTRTKLTQERILSVRPVTEPSYAVIAAVLTFVCFFLSFSTWLVLPAMPAMQAALNTDIVGISWLLSALLIGGLIGMLLFGKVGRGYRRKRVLILAVGLFAAGTAAAGLMNSVELVIVGRFAQGLGTGAFPLAVSSLIEKAPEHKRNQAIHLVHLAFGVGPVTGLLGSGVVAEGLGYDWLFWIPLIVSGPTLWLVWRLVPERSASEEERLEIGPIALLGTGALAVSLFFNQIPGDALGVAPLVGLGATGFGALRHWLRAEESLPPSDDPKGPRENPRVRRAVYMLSFLLSAAMYAFFLAVPQFTQLPRSTGFGLGASVLVSSLYVLPALLLPILATPVSTALCIRGGTKALLLSGIAMEGAGFALLASTDGTSAGVLLCSCLLGLGSGLSRPAIFGLLGESVSGSNLARSFTTYTSLMGLGAACGVQMAVASFAPETGGLPSFTGFHLVFWGATGFLVLCFVIGLGIISDDPPQNHPGPRQFPSERDAFFLAG
jgi:MFS family permease